MTASATHGSSEPAGQRLHVVQGEFAVSDEPGLMMTTILGSCVAACLHDPIAAVGGMNHFLLPGEDEASIGSASLRYGVQSMELLLNGLFRMGARRERLQAKLFGGARMIKGLTDVGLQNAAFAERFLKSEGIQLTGGSLRGEQARRLQFWPTSGRARQMALTDRTQVVFEAERAPPRRPVADQGAVELF